MKSVRESMADVDAILLITDASAAFGRGDEFTLELVKPVKTKKVLLLNKIDRLEKKKPASDHRSIFETWRFRRDHSDFRSDGRERGERDRSGFQAAPGRADVLSGGPDQRSAGADDCLRNDSREADPCDEQELPYSTAVVIDRFEEGEKIHRIFASIFVERDSQKAIVIGKGGQKLKEIGTAGQEGIGNLFRPKDLPRTARQSEKEVAR